jgi:spore coat polysaccharide biosynthesis protein SpsF
MKVIAVVQARMGSSRLRGKSLMKIAKYTLLETVINSIRRNHFINDVVVATTNLPQDDAIEKVCVEKGLKFFRGDSDNVLSRFISIAKMYSEDDVIVRVTADNPINNHKVSDLLFKYHIKEGNDYSYIEGLSHTVYEFVNVKTFLELEEVDNLVKEDKEHVTMYFRKGEQFKIGSLIPDEYGLDSEKDKLLTVDSKEDFDRFMKLKHKVNLDSAIDFTKLYETLERLD